MICEKCKSEGRTSKVYVGGDMSTLVHCSPFYDEEGKMHIHDPNTYIQSLRCSNGHEWTEKGGGSCWCGWNVDRRDMGKEKP